MAKSRKTIEVAKLREMANEMLLNSSDDFKGQREGIIILLEQILVKTNNCRGFGYLNPDDMLHGSENGTTVGINKVSFSDMPCEEWFIDTDHTRVTYY